MKRIFCFFSISLFLFLNVYPQQKRSMTLVDMLEIPVLSSPPLSPDGNQIVYTLARADWKANRRISHIWRASLDGNNIRQLTNGEESERSPRWSPDGSCIAFIAERGGAKISQIFLIYNDGGEAIQLTHHKTSVSSLSWSPDGSYLYFLASDPKTAEEKKREKLNDDVYAFEENYHQRHLWKVSISDGKEEKITSGNFSIISYQLSRDGEKVAFHRANSPVREDADKSEVWVMDVDGQNMRQITRNGFPESNAALSPDDQQILFLSDANGNFEYYYNRNLFVASLRNGEIHLLLPDLPYEIQQAFWSNDGKSIFLKANLGVHTELFKYSLQKKKLKQLTNGKHDIRSWNFFPKLSCSVYCEQNTTNAGDVWLLDMKKKNKPNRITHVYDYLADTFQLPKVEVIHWKGKDGVTVEGLLYYPLHYQKGKAYPLWVQTHGGPRSSDKYGPWRWRTYIPVVTAKGYAVFLPNYRGSTGYGDNFLRDMVGHYFHNAHLDVMKGVDYLIEHGIADSSKMVKSGWSAGGHMTNKIITFTSRFKAASSGAGAMNWISMYAQSDTRLQRTSWFGGTPWEKGAPIDVYWNSSPLKDVWKVKTPTIIFVGKEDVRVPMPQSVELYRALRSNGVPTRLYVAPREPHGWGELRHELFKMNAELEWFEKYAMGRKYTWEKAPEIK